MAICELDLRRAERTINALIEYVKKNGGGVFLIDKTNKDFSVELEHPVSIAFFTYK